MNIDRRKREQAKGKISFYLQAEQMQPGERIPAERRLCDVPGVSHINVRSALSELIQERNTTSPHRILFLSTYFDR
ncbi:MAG: hypothetical protein A2X48_22050 [Lentisphaerae bacterium GWF2_49_21]|nr:MAG: hypothetical protein A2X48_22050 [Lentisphaerae bacterium GWF2_49_21]